MNELLALLIYYSGFLLNETVLKLGEGFRLARLKELKFDLRIYQTSIVA